MRGTVSLTVDIDIDDFYDGLYPSDKKTLLNLLKEDNFEIENEDLSGKLKVLFDNFFRFTREDEDILEGLFKKYNI